MRAWAESSPILLFLHGPGRGQQTFGFSQAGDGEANEVCPVHSQLFAEFLQLFGLNGAQPYRKSNIWRHIRTLVNASMRCFAML
jgi:hypothetical protein